MSSTPSTSDELTECLWYPLALSDGFKPSARVGHTVNVLYPTSEADQRPFLLLLGGADTNNTFNEANLMDVTADRWYNLPIPQEIEPPKLARYEHTSALIGKEVYIFGGATKLGPLSEISCMLINQRPAGDAEQANSSSPPFNLLPAPKTPATFLHTARTQYGSASTTEFHQFLVFAGAGLGSEPVLDSQVHMYDSVINAWKALETTGDLPAARFGHFAAYQTPAVSVIRASGRTPGGRLYLHGGMTESEFFDDVYELVFNRSSDNDVVTATWRKVFPSQSDPSMVPDEGYGRSTSETDRLGVALPCARAAHGGAILPTARRQANSSMLFIFGGLSSMGALNDAFSFNIELGQWTEIRCTGTLPRPRLDFAYCLFSSPSVGVASTSGSKNDDKLKQYFFIHGGMDVEGNLFDDCMVLPLPTMGED